MVSHTFGIGRYEVRKNCVGTNIYSDSTTCLAPEPRDRLSATELTHHFLLLPSRATKATIPILEPRTSLSSHTGLEGFSPHKPKTYLYTAAKLRHTSAKNISSEAIALKPDYSEPCKFPPPLPTHLNFTLS